MSDSGPGGAPQGTSDGQQQGPPGGQMEIDTAAAAATLGVTEDELIAALGDLDQGPPDFATAAVTLGVTEEALMEALGISGSPGGQPGGEGGPGGPGQGG